MINNIVVVGSGVMGRGIAYVSALGGFTVTLNDSNEAALQNAQNELNQIFEKGLSRGKISVRQSGRGKEGTSIMQQIWQTL